MGNPGWLERSDPGAGNPALDYKQAPATHPTVCWWSSEEAGSHEGSSSQWLLPGGLLSSGWSGGHPQLHPGTLGSAPETSGKAREQG